MDKDKAIEILKEIIDEGWLISDFDKCIAIDACEMAIKSLEAWEKLKEDIEGMKSDRMSGDTPLVMKIEVLHIINEYIKDIENP